MRETSLAHYILVTLLVLSQIVLHSAEEPTQCQKLSPFDCGEERELSFPFFRIDGPKYGVIAMNCTGTNPKVRFSEKGKWYQVKNISYLNMRMKILDEDVQGQCKSNRCDLLANFTEQAYLLNFNERVPPFTSFEMVETGLFFKCKHKANFPSTSFDSYSCNSCALYFHKKGRQLPPLPENLTNGCSVVRLPHPIGAGKDSLASYLGPYFTIVWKVREGCLDCYHKGWQCQSTKDERFECSKNKGPNVRKKILIGVGAAVGTFLLTCIAFILYRRHKRNRSSSSSALISRDLSRDNSLKPDPEKGSLFFETKLFTYKELDEATNHFDSNKELGDGGFGTVYHGKLRDGRVVAVKRLFEHNYKRVEQFMNEIEILSRLRHQNLVSLYGCTSRHSRELLLVYEFVPNGTVADHLHGELAKDGLLTWPIRMSIAIQSADALAYLHASEIIHRDVKTNNILLDNNFHVKVADFGLSRLFPTDVTHVSTAPQGTPGYVDPEYYQCYQLTNKSDVYSFGVVLIELISSKPAVDIGRHRHEINLANLAINRIQHQALHELVDPSLGYDTDYSVRNMITLVAELAFRCLQQENEMRPCMTEVLEILRGIENDENKKRNTDDMDTSAVARLLKNSEPLSPDTVTGKWPSKESTPNTSG